MHLIFVVETHKHYYAMKTSIEQLHWLPRILGIGAILLVSLFALDAFEGDKSVSEQILAFLIHLIPSFILLAILLLAWFYERLGGIIFAVIGLGFAPFLFTMNYNRSGSVWVGLSVVLLINLPFIITGALFILSHYLKKKNTPAV